MLKFIFMWTIWCFRKYIIYIWVLWRKINWVIICIWFIAIERITLIYSREKLMWELHYEFNNATFQEFKEHSLVIISLLKHWLTLDILMQVSVFLAAPIELPSCNSLLYCCGFTTLPWNYERFSNEIVFQIMGLGSEFLQCHKSSINVDIFKIQILFWQ